MITGPPGIGKTELVASGVQAHARHFCRTHVISSADPVRAFADIAGQLARTVPGYGMHGGLYRGGGEQAAQIALNAGQPASAYDHALHFPLSGLAAAQPHAAQVLVVIDGLDEAGAGDRRHPLADLLAERLGSGSGTAAGVRLLLTTRPGPVADRLAGLPTFDLHADAPRDGNGVRTYLEAHSALPARVRRAVASAADGNHLYAEVAVRLAAAGRRALLRDAPPFGLDALYDLALADVGGADSLGRRVLAVLARAKDRGLTAAQIAAILGEARSAVDAALANVEHLLTGTRWRRLHHRCLAERVDAAAAADPGAADWRIAAALLPSGGRAAKVKAAPYTARNLVAHLADAGKRGAEAVATSLADPEFLTTALATAGVDDLLSAISYLNRRLQPQASAEAINAAEAAEAVLRGQARVLRAVPGRCDQALLKQQLLYEAATIGETPLARRLAAELNGAGIATLWATQDSPWRFLPNASRGHGNQVSQLAITSDGTRAMSASDGATRVWRLASGRVAQTIATSNKITALYPAPDSGHVVAATADGGAELLDTDRGEPVQQLAGSRTAMVTAFAVSAGGTRAVSGDIDGHVTIWDLTLGEPTRRLPSPARLVTAVAITPDGGTAAAGVTGGVLVWDAASGEVIAHLPRSGPVTALALSPAADRLLVGGDHLEVYTLSERAATLTDRLLVHHRVTALAINPAMPAYALVGTAFGQVAYVQLANRSHPRS